MITCDEQGQGTYLMKYFFKQCVGAVMLTTLFLQASSVEELMDEFSQKNALSQSTIDKNKGHLLLYTRDILERMHAKTLKDVLKTIPITQYNENRYGLPDPLSSGGISPYSSNFVRVYVDGVEITQGWMGSGLIQYGDINIDFADHIELYAIPPSFDTAVEPAYMTIFIYSKDPERDSGGKVSLIQDHRGGNTQTLGYGDKEDGVSYMVNLSHSKVKRGKVSNGTDRPLSRDFDRTQIFSYVKTQNQIFHFQLINKKSDTLAGLSYDATPLVSEMDNLNVHLDYGIDLSEHWNAKIAYDYLNTDLRQEDDIPLLIAGGLFTKTLYTTTKNSTYSAELTYQNVFGKHHLALGTKGRLKRLDSLRVKDLGEVLPAFHDEGILSAFVQDQYELSENELITLGIKYSYVTRNNTFDDDNLMQVRLGYLYNNDTWSYKAYIFRNMFSIDPFSRYFYRDPKQSFDPQITVGITQEIAYHNEKNDARFMIFFIKEKNNLIDLENIDKSTSLVTVMNYDYKIDTDTKLNTQFSYVHYFDLGNFGNVNAYSSYVMLSNQYDDISFYNGVVWNQDSIRSTNYFEWTSSISWDVTEDWTFTLKGENLFDKAQPYSIFRINPQTGSMIQPLSVSPIEQRISIEVEYLF